jgi:hypothetical protein
MPVEYLTPAVEERVVEVQHLRADRGQPPSWLKIMHRVLVVPWSIAATNSAN